MDGNVITLFIDIVHIGDVVDIAGQVPGCLYGNIRVVTQYFHTQVCSRVGHLYADSSKTDDTQLLALNFMACELLLLLFRKLTDILIHALGLYPVHSADDISGCQQHTCQYQLFYTVGIGARRIENYDTLIRAFGQRNIIDSGSGPGDGLQILREIYLMERGTSD